MSFKELGLGMAMTIFSLGEKLWQERMWVTGRKEIINKRSFKIDQGQRLRGLENEFEENTITIASKTMQY